MTHGDSQISTTAYASNQQPWCSSASCRGMFWPPCHELCRHVASTERRRHARRRRVVIGGEPIFQTHSGSPHLVTSEQPAVMPYENAYRSRCSMVAILASPPLMTRCRDGALVKAGAPAVVATMREVMDEAAARFSREFYQQMRKPGPKCAGPILIRRLPRPLPATTSPKSHNHCAEVLVGIDRSGSIASLAP